MCYRSLEGQICVVFTLDLTFLTHRWSSKTVGLEPTPARGGGCAQGHLPMTAGEEQRPEVILCIPGPLTWVTCGPDLWASVYFPQGSWQPPSLSLGSLPWRRQTQGHIRVACALLSRQFTVRYRNKSLST